MIYEELISSSPFLCPFLGSFVGRPNSSQAFTWRGAFTPDKRRGALEGEVKLFIQVTQQVSARGSSGDLMQNYVIF